jgi:hypothetical protein
MFFYAPQADVTRSDSFPGSAWERTSSKLCFKTTVNWRNTNCWRSMGKQSFPGMKFKAKLWNEKKDSRVDETEVNVVRDTSAWTAWAVLRLMIAGLLFVAAVAKVVNAVQILHGHGLLNSPPLLFALIAFEGAVATYLLIGDRNRAWRISVATFTMFVVAAGYASWTGRDCNCIAQSIGPRQMMFVDIIVLVLAFWFRPRSSAGQPSVTPRQVALSLIVAAAFAAAGLLSISSGDNANPLKFLIADTMVGAQWPLDSRFHPDLEPLETGNWMVIILRRDCEHCREFVSEFFAEPDRHRANERTAVFVAGTSNWPFQFDRVSMPVGSATLLRWRDDEPFVASPAVFVLRERLVVEAADREDAEVLCRGLLSEPRLHSQRGEGFP